MGFAFPWALISLWRAQIIHLQAATREVETELEEIEECDNPLIACALDMVVVMKEVELLLQ